MIRLEVIAQILTTYRHCMHCEQLMDAAVGEQARQEMLREYPAEFLDEFERLMTWIEDLSHQFALQVRVIDPQSPEGLWKCLRYGIHHYPAFILPGRRRVVGWDRSALQAALREVAGQDGETVEPPA